MQANSEMQNFAQACSNVRNKKYSIFAHNSNHANQVFRLRKLDGIDWMIHYGLLLVNLMNDRLPRPRHQRREVTTIRERGSYFE